MFTNKFRAQLESVTPAGILADLEKAARRKLRENGCRPKISHPAPGLKFLRHELSDVRQAADLLNAVTFLATQVADHGGVIRAALRAGALSTVLHLEPLIARGEKFTPQPRNEHRDSEIVDLHDNGKLSFGQIGLKLDMTSAAVEKAYHRLKARQ